MLRGIAVVAMKRGQPHTEFPRFSHFSRLKGIHRHRILRLGRYREMRNETQPPIRTKFLTPFLATELPPREAEMIAGVKARMADTNRERPHAWLDDMNMTPQADKTEEEKKLLGHRPMVYQLPLYGHDNREEIIDNLPIEKVYKLLSVYGCPFYSMDVWGHPRLKDVTKFRHLTRKVGVVATNRHKTQATVMVRYMRYNWRYRYRYWFTRKLKCHDEFNICRLGDVVVIQAQRFEKWEKNFTVVQNYGNKEKLEGIERAERMKELIDAVEYDPEVAQYLPADSRYKKMRKRIKRFQWRAAGKFSRRQDKKYSFKRFHMQF